MQKLFIAEFAEELRGFLLYCGSRQMNPADFLVVALQPEVKVLCKAKELDYIDTLEFFDTDSHEQVLKKSHELTTLIAGNLVMPGTAAEQKVLLDTFIFYSRFYINNYLWIIEILKGIKEKYTDENLEIFVFRRAVRGGVSDPQRDGYLLKRDRYLDTLVEKYSRGEKNRVKVRVIEHARESTVEKIIPRDGRVKKWLKNFARRLYQAKLKALSTHKTVFIAASSYNLDRVCREIREKFPQVRAVTHLPLPVTMPGRGYLKMCLKELKNKLMGPNAEASLTAVPVDLFNPKSSNDNPTELDRIKESYRDFAAQHYYRFTYEGCTFWEEFNRKVETDLLGTLAWIKEGAEGQKRFLEILKPGLVMSPVSTAEYQSWAEVSGRLGIPAVVIPQKTLVKPSNETAGIEEYYIGRAQVTDTFSHVAAQSPLVTRYLEWAGYKGNIIETGNLIFARLDKAKRKEKRERFFKEINGNKKVIVWAPSMKTRKSRRFYVLESIDELLSAMEDVFQVVSRMEDVHLIFRIHPGEAITKDEIYALLEVPANVTVSDSGAFEDVLALADLVISFSSTAAQEALINYIPVLSYDKWNRYNHLEARPTDGTYGFSDGFLETGVTKGSEPGKAAATYYINKKENLAPGIRWILEEHTKKEVPREIFRDYVFIEDKNRNFLEFVEQPRGAGSLLELASSSPKSLAKRSTNGCDKENIDKKRITGPRAA